MWDFYKTNVIKAARKKHRCSWCAEFIERGESYTTVGGKWGGEFSFAKMHPECYTAYSNDPALDELEEWMPYQFKRGKMSGESLYGYSPTNGENQR